MAPDNNPQAGQGRSLPKKEGDLFKNVVKHYEMKQYKKAVKQADTILKKFPNHGETLAMKGLVLNCLTKRDEAHALVKQGLMNDMRYAFIYLFIFHVAYLAFFVLLTFFSFQNFIFIQVTCLLACLWPFA